ncbi:hypothetical protein G7K71_14155 [Desulfofundulus sp. TPOSR]|uniref:HD-GYP domain-containing protein n=1 Tax=Desulfofundulus sp. TPOSR TaxID=2714340 RepID=UPI00140CC559|nr:hypothetical protein [Desulfofundulus sp. TPOSR]
MTGQALVLNTYVRGGGNPCKIPRVLLYLTDNASILNIPLLRSPPLSPSLFVPSCLTTHWSAHFFHILSHIPELKEISLLMLYHERYDGRGYPQGLKGEDTPLGARILAVADSYDAMTSYRVYRPAMTNREALEINLPLCGHAF